MPMGKPSMQGRWDLTRPVITPQGATPSVIVVSNSYQSGGIASAVIDTEGRDGHIMVNAYTGSSTTAVVRNGDAVFSGYYTAAGNHLDGRWASLTTQVDLVTPGSTSAGRGNRYLPDAGSFDNAIIAAARTIIGASGPIVVTAQISGDTLDFRISDGDLLVTFARVG